MSSRRFSRVAVLKGGWSAEREVSLVTARECASALLDAGYEVVEIDAGRRDIAEKLVSAAPEVVFNALHGRWGEDGCVQGLLEVIGVPYSHSGVLASALAMDKTRAKKVYAEAGLPVADSILIPRTDLDPRNHPMQPPYVLKPNNEGSSVGVYIVSEGANAPPEIAADDASEIFIAEKYVPGRELTVAVMDGRPLAVTDIRASSGWYDYDAKYSDGGSVHVVPADLPDGITKRCLEMAATAHDALGCRGLSRSDFRWDEAAGEGGLVILETNTQPGMTPTSLAPEQAAHCGISFTELVTWMVEDASCGR